MPMAPDLDLDPFFELMANEKVIKVFHAARQDIEIVYHLGGLIPHPVFDTQVAAMVCGFGDSISYDQLVHRLTGARHRQVVALHRLEPAAAVRAADRIRARRRHPPPRRLSGARGAARRAEPDRVGARGDGGADLAGDLPHRAGGGLEAPQAPRPQADRARRPAGGRRLARARGAGARRAARPGPQGRRHLRDRRSSSRPPPTALGQLRTIPRGFERSRAADEILAAVREALAIPKDQLAASCPSTGRRPTATAPPSTSSRCS